MRMLIVLAVLLGVLSAQADNFTAGRKSITKLDVFMSFETKDVSARLDRQIMLDLSHPHDFYIGEEQSLVFWGSYQQRNDKSVYIVFNLFEQAPSDISHAAGLSCLIDGGECSIQMMDDDGNQLTIVVNLESPEASAY